MKALLFDVDGQRYGLDITQVLKVLPYVRLRPLSGVPRYVAGILRYRDEMIPVIDLSQLIGGTPVPPMLSTRLILVAHPGPSGAGRTLGLLAERATDILEDGAARPEPSGYASSESPYLGGLSVSGKSMVQFVRVENLLPDDLSRRLFVES
jgi:chemotaxis-related protein WspB